MTVKGSAAMGLKLGVKDGVNDGVPVDGVNVGIPLGVKVGEKVGKAVGTIDKGVPIMQLYCLEVSLTRNPGTVGQSKHAR